MRTKEEILDYLNSFENNAFRKDIDAESETYIFDNQIEAAKEVVANLASNVLRSNHVILVAKMQSGKTGTCNAIANMVMNTELRREMAVNKVMFITGMNDCGLASQTYSRAISQITTANSNNVFDATKNTSNVTHPKFYVLKNSTLKYFNGNINGTLIFIDEAHFGSRELNVLTKFMVSKGIDWKNQNSLISNNVYIVSVSATPFEELVSDVIDCKPMVELKTNNTYVGVSEYFEKELVHSADKNDIKNGIIFEYIEEAYTRMDENSEKGIVIIRTRDFEKILENTDICKKFEIYKMYANGSKIEYDKLADKMREMIQKNEHNTRLYYRSNMDERVTADETEIKPLLVLIKGAFRAGITIEAAVKDLIYMVYDYSTCADATAQALLGRMCGYRNMEQSVFNTHFYINTTLASMYADWEKDFTNKELIPSSRTQWVWMDNDYEGFDTKLGTKPCGNFSINLSSDDLKILYQKVCKNKHQNHATEQIMPELLRKYGYNIHYDYFLEAYMSGKNKYAKSTQEKRFDSFSSSSLVFQFLPEKIKSFKENTGRNHLIKEDIGKRAIGVVLDATIDVVNGKIIIGGNRRLLVYYVEVGQKKRMANHKSQYKVHKDTSLVAN